MKYPKRNYKRKRPYNKKGKLTNKKLYNKIENLSKNIHNQIEYKHFDEIYTELAVDFPAPPSTFHLEELGVNLAQGSGDTDRDGDKIFITSLDLRLQIKGNARSLGEQKVRMIVFRLKPSLLGAADPNTVNWVENLFSPEITSSGTGYEMPTSLWRYNIDYMRNKSVKIMTDKILTLTPRNIIGVPQGANNTTQVDTVQFRKKYSCRFNRQYVGASDTITGNRMFMMLLPEQANGFSATTYPISYQASTRLNYSDL